MCTDTDKTVFQPCFINMFYSDFMKYIENPLEVWRRDALQSDSNTFIKDEEI